MTIQELADAHVGHAEEIEEDLMVTAQRESFKQGALKVLDMVEHFVLNNCNTCSLTVLNYIKELKGEL